MYRPRSKRFQLITRIAVYGLMTSMVGALVCLSLLYLVGYRLDSKNNTVERGGLIQYVSSPNGATISIDGTELTQRTPAKNAVSPGKHTFRMSRTGYHPWQKTLTIDAGTLTWLNYTRLIPQQLTPEMVHETPVMAAALSSPDNRRIITLGDVAHPTFDIYVIDSDKVTHTIFTLPADTYAPISSEADKHQFSFVKWDSSGHYVTVKHTYGTETEWLVIDGRDGKLVSNVSQTMDIPITDLQFANSSGKSFYVLTGQDVRKINLDNQTLSKPLASGVSEFGVYDSDTISYVATGKTSND